MSNFACPNCHSEDVVKFSVAYMEGTQNIKATTYSGGVLGSDFGAAVGKTKGTAQSLSAANSAPPAKKKVWFQIFSGIFGRYFLAWIVGLILGSLFGNVVGSSAGDTIGDFFSKVMWFLCVAGGFRLAYQNYKWNQEEYPAVLEAWNHTYYCRRCGSVFQV